MCIFKIWTPLGPNLQRIVPKFQSSEVRLAPAAHGNSGQTVAKQPLSDLGFAAYQIGHFGFRLTSSTRYAISVCHF